MKASAVLCSAVMAVLGAFVPAVAQDLMPVCDGGRDVALSVGPTLNSAPSFKERFGGAAEARACVTGANEAFGLAGWHGLAVGGRYLLVDKDVVTPDVSEARATLLYGVTWFTTNDVDIDLEAEPTPGGLVTSYGWTELGMTGSYEESADRSERGVTAGAVLRYGHERHAWVPSIAVRYEIARSTHSEARRAAGEDEEDLYERFGADIYWNFPLRFVSETLEALSLGADFSYFHAWSVDPVLEDADSAWKSGIFGGGTIRWNGPVPLLAGFSISDVYARYAGGHKAIDPEDEDGFRLGIDLAWSAGSGP